MKGPVHKDGSFKRITEYTDADIEKAIQSGIAECKKAGLDFWTILRGIDAYREKRKRKWGK